MKKAMICLVSIVSILLIGIGLFFSIRAINKPRFTINDTLSDGNGKEAKVIILSGQSNASGISRDDCLRENVSAEKYTEYEKGYDNVYINYFSSDKNQSKEFVKCSTLQGELEGCFGPELGMAERLNEMYPDEMFFIIKYAWGNTSLYEHWLSPSSKGKTGKLYNQMISFIETSLKYLESKNYDIEIVGMCWMQGESDAFDVKTASDYKENLSNFIADVRDEFSCYAADTGIIFVDAYIAASPMYWVYYAIVNQSKKAVADSSPINILIDTIDYGLTTNKEPFDNPDIAHYDSLSEIKLGHLFIVKLAQFFK